MISVTATTGKYILQPSLVEMHNFSQSAISASDLWRDEISFFQKLLDRYSTFFTSTEDKKRIDHFQNLILYYGSELILSLQKKLRHHESDLATMLKELNESDTTYFKEHEALMKEVESFSRSMDSFKREFYQFMEPALTSR